MMKSMTKHLALVLRHTLLHHIFCSMPVSSGVDSAKKQPTLQSHDAVCSKHHGMFTFVRCGRLNQQWNAQTPDEFGTPRHHNRLPSPLPACTQTQVRLVTHAVWQFAPFVSWNWHSNLQFVETRLDKNRSLYCTTRTIAGKMHNPQPTPKRWARVWNRYHKSMVSDHKVITARNMDNSSAHTQDIYSWSRL